MLREVGIALDWWRASGERNKPRLESLVRHYCQTYARDDEFTEAAVAESFQHVQSWELVE